MTTQPKDDDPTQDGTRELKHDGSEDPSAEGSATVELDPESAPEDPRETAGTTREVRPEAARALEHLGGEVRRGIVAHGWDRAALAALTGFAAVLAVGSVFVVMAKLAVPDFGSGKSPLWIMARIGVAGLGALGIPIERAGEGASVLPVGALMLVGWILAWATRKVVETSGAFTLRERVLEGLKVAIPFALGCFIASFVFRLRDRDPSLGADPSWALILGLVWGAIFGALGGLWAGGVRDAADAGDRWLENRPLLRDGLRTGATMLVGLGLLSAVVVVAAIALKVAFGGAPPISGGEAAAFVLAVILFGPNLVAGAAAFSLGGPVGVLARTIDGARVASEVSLLGWDAGRPSAYLYLLILVPAAAFAYGGYHARRSGAGSPAEVIGIAAGVVGVSVAFLTWITRLRVSQAFLGRGNYLVAAADVLPAFVLSVASAGLFGYLGWRAGDKASTKNPV